VPASGDMIVRLAELSEQNARLQARVAALENSLANEHDEQDGSRDLTTK
jgi:uncharacterized protein YigA (DUF484 family)